MMDLWVGLCFCLLAPGLVFVTTLLMIGPSTETWCGPFRLHRFGNWDTYDKTNYRQARACKRCGLIQKR